MVVPPDAKRGLRGLIVPLVVLACAAAAYLLILERGAALPAPPSELQPEQRVASHGDGTMASVLLALAVITLCARLCGGVFRRWLGQPAVMGEIFAGLALGPSLLGVLVPDATATLFPDAIVPTLSVLSKVGIVMFMFLVGLELDPRTLRGRARETVGIASAGILLPFLLGSLIALWLFSDYAGEGVSFAEFSLLIGVSLSVTAFPVLARILLEMRAMRTRLGALAMACAALGDVAAWTLLALVAGVATAHPAGAALTVAWVAVYAAVMLLVIRPLLRAAVARLEAQGGPIRHSVLAAVFVGLLLSAFATEAIGIHGLFGAFVFGVILPHDGPFAEQVRERIADFVTVFLLPVFFAFSGLRTQVGLLDSGQDWLFAGAILLVASVGKFGGVLVAARFAGLGWRPAAALGVLMNTRGLMELVVLNLGLDLGLITPTLFTMLVLMTLTTTFATPPLVRWILGPRGFEDEPEPAPRPAQRAAV